LKKDEVAGEKVKMLSFLRAEERRWFLSFICREAWFSGPDLSNLGSTQPPWRTFYDLRRTSAVLICSFFVKRGQQDYGTHGMSIEVPSILLKPHGVSMVKRSPPISDQLS